MLYGIASSSHFDVREILSSQFSTGLPLFLSSRLSCPLIILKFYGICFRYNCIFNLYFTLELPVLAFTYLHKGPTTSNLPYEECYHCRLTYLYSPYFVEMGRNGSRESQRRQYKVSFIHKNLREQITWKAYEEMRI